MADREDFATAVGQLIKGRSLVGHTHAWGEVTGKPSTFPPSAHTHTVANVTGLRAELDALSQPMVTQISTGIYGVGDRHVASISTGIYQIGA